MNIIINIAKEQKIIVKIDISSSEKFRSMARKSISIMGCNNIKLKTYFSKAMNRKKKFNDKFDLSISSNKVIFYELI